ncbi:MAG: DUF1615 domain-containing protein [Nitrospinae bacterium]|nr:DUF1615 domain-containing protein [Nitrospinota bacterium]
MKFKALLIKTVCGALAVSWLASCVSMGKTEESATVRPDTGKPVKTLPKKKMEKKPKKPPAKEEEKQAGKPEERAPFRYPSAGEGRAMVARLLPSYVKDRDGWATDIFTAFSALSVAPTDRNFCGVVAIIEQESSFEADPAVPGLSTIAWKEIEERRARHGIPQSMIDIVLDSTSPDKRTYRQRIDSSRTENDLSKVFEDLPGGKGILAGFNPVRTAGAMQVNVEYAERHAKLKPYPYAIKGSMRRELFTRRGGVYFGVAHLLDYLAPYNEMRYRFADFNAGHYSSRNAAFQAVVSMLSGVPVALDGDLMSRNPETGETFRALMSISGRLGLTRPEILRDLKMEKSAGFAATGLYTRVYALADPIATGRRAIRATIPQIKLQTSKSKRNLTTEWFVERVNRRFVSCIARSGPSGQEDDGGM